MLTRDPANASYRLAVFDETYDGAQFRLGSNAMTLQAIGLSLSPLIWPENPSTLARCTHTADVAEFASFVDQSIPTTMMGGQLYPATLTFRNTGENTWSVNDGYVLTAEGPDTAPAWSVSPVALPNAVSPDQEVVFTVNLNAPLASGTFPLQFQLKKGTEAFGGTSVTIAVSVQ